WKPGVIPLLFLPLVFIVLVRLDPQLGPSIGNAPVKIAAITTAILVAGASVGLLKERRDVPGGSAITFLIPLLLLAALFWEPTGREILDIYRNEPDHPQLYSAIDVNVSSTDPGGAGEFLQEQLATSVEPFRYFGYDGMRLRTKRRSGETYHG